MGRSRASELLGWRAGEGYIRFYVSVRMNKHVLNPPASQVPQDRPKYPSHGYVSHCDLLWWMTVRHCSFQNHPKKVYVCSFAYDPFSFYYMLTQSHPEGCSPPAPLPSSLMLALLFSVCLSVLLSPCSMPGTGASRTAVKIDLPPRARRGCCLPLSVTTRKLHGTKGVILGDLGFGSLSGR